MGKKTTLFISVLLILAGIIIYVLLKDSNTKMDEELIGFFSGICFGAGVILPVRLFFDKKKK
ncbi:hypothetical protein SAMN05444274_107199 [Mariniphaga anaerophila]|uniref:Uncharacterized protein n=1 Tax=Mariniphaga anaerophila TaxID=1484053 RepID=A0A1M5DQB0_9BACT|nr:hypothetical protein [Mariniphaga anaerophila]SHF69031.1 hypothetical protein SAMN05444274_107199 [Mariniphaga anaerophila]